VSKLKVQADPDDVLVQLDGCIYRWVGRNIVAATIAVVADCIVQIDEEILDLERPILRERPLQSRARCPAKFSIILVRQAVQCRFYIRAGAARRQLRLRAGFVAS
jgi:hypothetical protein